MTAKVQYYGIRGSTPAAGSQFEKYGGNTTCVAIQMGDENIIIDAGTGIRRLGEDILKKDTTKLKDIRILFTHTHWDHIQGFPFFIPAYLPNIHLHIYGETKTIKRERNGKEIIEEWNIKKALWMQQGFMYFPVDTHYMLSKKTFYRLYENQNYKIGNLKFKTIKLQHPNNTLGFRFEFDNGSFCFCTDVEHSKGEIEKIIKFAQGSDVLAYDCQYTPDEYERQKKGWGHSTYQAGVQIAREAGVKELHMIHHDPFRNDDSISAIEASAKKLHKDVLSVPEGHTIVF